MRIGTKSVLFGVHQFILHPLFVLYAWFILYRQWPSLRELCAILTHDLGYLGSPNMDGEEGERHPEIIANLWVKHFGCFGDGVSHIILGHSRFYAKIYGGGLSKLFRPDKLSIALYPKFLYLLLGNLSGEIQEYMQNSKYANLALKKQGQIIWLLEVQAHTTLMGTQGGDYAPVKEQMGKNNNG